ncbi:MAG: hypothetical protein OEY18_16635, partial [Candidatus Aminicenantes bacterium]|nr:hypothetical protein [Candidatus Aminicenantes bacterium]
MPSDSKYDRDEVHDLISKGRKRGYLLFEEIDKTFQDEFDSEEEFDEFISSMDGFGIKIRYKRREYVPKKRKSDIVSLEGLERTTDPVKLYLREMGNISLLTREGEIAIAREIERGEKTIIKALSKTRIVLNEVLSIEDKLKNSPEILLEMFEISEDDISEGELEEKKKQIQDKIKKIRSLSEQLDSIPQRKKFALARGRLIVQMSRLIRNLNIRESLQEEIIENLREKLKVINELEETREELNISLRQAQAKKATRKEADLIQKIKDVNKLLRTYQQDIGLDSQALRRTLRAITTGRKVSDQAKKELVAANLRLVVS